MTFRLHKKHRENYWNNTTLQNVVMFPVDLVYSIRVYLKNCRDKTHVLDGGLERGQWYDLCWRIPRCLFSELEKFIEVEKGLDVHEWEKTLTFDEEWGYGPENENYGKLTPQAIAAIEQDEIYKWWKSVKEVEEWDGRGSREEEMLIRLIKIRGSLWT